MGSNIDVSSTGALVNRLMNPPNPMEQLGQTIQGVNALKSFQANQASADAYRQSVDPQTGEVDLGKYKAIMSQGPGAWLFGPQTEQAGHAVGAVGQGTTADVQSKMAQLGAVGQFLTPLAQRIANGEQISGAEAQAQLDQAHKMGLVNDQLYGRVSGEIAQIPQGGNANGIIQGAVIGNEGAMRAISPHYEGAGGYIFQTNPFFRGGNPAAAPVVTTTMTPDTAGQLVPVQLGGNQTAQMPLGEAIRFLHNNPQYQQFNPNITAPAPAPAPGAGGGAGGAAPGRYPQPPQEPQPPATGPAYKQPPGPAPKEAGGVGVTAVPGYAETVQQPSMKAATALVTAANDTPNVSALIDDMRSQVNQPGWNPGLGAQAGSTWRQVLDKMGVNATGAAPTAIKDAQAAYDEFAKDANLIASRQLATIGNPSDARQGLAEAITPGMAQSKEGVLGISATLKGNQDAINRTSAAWNEAKANGWTDNRHLEWLNKNWNATDKASGGKFDPRVFWLADTAGTADDQWRRMASKIPKEQQAQFAKNVQYAKDQGWINQPGGPGTALAVMSP